jgi:hypothetical protein
MSYGIKPGSPQFFALKRGVVGSYGRWGHPIAIDREDHVRWEDRGEGRHDHDREFKHDHDRGHGRDHDRDEHGHHGHDRDDHGKKGDHDRKGKGHGHDRDDHGKR